jgi:hypothetical protein
MTKSESYIDTILSILANGIVERGKALAKFGKKWQVSNRTFDRAWKIAQERYAITQQKANEVAEAVILQEVKDNALNSVKTKTQRLEVYQKQIDATISEIENGMTEELIFVGGQPKKSMRKHTVNETAILRRTLRDLQSEISKIQGDYAPTKINQENTGIIRVVRE